MTLRHNRPQWNVLEQDVTTFSAREHHGIDLLAGGVPCPPFSKAGKQLGPNDERDLFPQALRLVEESEPRAVMLENVRGLLDDVFHDYREQISCRLRVLGYRPDWKLLNACDFGVSQLRSRVLMVALREDVSQPFVWPAAINNEPPTVGAALYDMMATAGWRGVDAWRREASGIAPTIVGGSKKHGGPDLGPTRAKRGWAELGVNGHLIGNAPPAEDFEGLPTLTIPMVAKLQGFPEDWVFCGAKTNAYRQVGNAFPPPVARAVAARIKAHLWANKQIPAYRNGGKATTQFVPVAEAAETGYEDAKEMLGIMVDGKRLKDISDLPLDLAV